MCSSPATIVRAAPCATSVRGQPDGRARSSCTSRAQHEALQVARQRQSTTAFKGDVRQARGHRRHHLAGHRSLRAAPHPLHRFGEDLFADHLHGPGYQSGACRGVAGRQTARPDPLDEVQRPAFAFQATECAALVSSRNIRLQYNRSVLISQFTLHAPGTVGGYRPNRIPEPGNFKPAILRNCKPALTRLTCCV